LGDRNPAEFLIILSLCIFIIKQTVVNPTCF
jgi:hypothetical protein